LDNHSNGNYIEEIKSKIQNFKEIKKDYSQNKNDLILNFEVNREALNKFKKRADSGKFHLIIFHIKNRRKECSRK
jgi:hypothetical protein